MEENIITHNSTEYVGYSLLSYGDYDGSADVERANVRYMENQHSDMPSVRESNITRDGFSGSITITDIDDDLGDVFSTRGGFGGKSIYIKKDSDLDNHIGHSLSNYPVLADDVLSELQEEMKEEAYESYGRDEVVNVIEKNHEVIQNMKLDEDGDFDIDDNFCDVKLRAIWDKIVEKEEGVFEGDSFFVDTAGYESDILELANELSEEKSHRFDKSSSLEP